MQNRGRIMPHSCHSGAETRKRKQKELQHTKDCESGSSNPVLTDTTNTPTSFPSGRHAAGCEQPRCSLLPHPSPLLGRERLVPGAVSALISAPRRSATEQLLCPQTSQPRAVEEPRGEAAPARGGRGAQGSILQDSYQSKHGEQDGCHYIHVREYKSILHS